MTSSFGWWWAVLALAAAGLAFAAWRRHRALAAELQAERVQARTLEGLLDVWQWRTDATHRLVQLRPPRGAPVSSWTALAADNPLWTQFRCTEDHALRACLDARAPIDDLTAQVTLPGGGAASCVVRGGAITDALGRFAGYVGTARMLSMTAAQPAPAAPADPAPEAPHDAEH